MFAAALIALALLLVLSLVAWLVSLFKHAVSIVDSLWPLLILAGGLSYAAALPESGPRTVCVLALASLWAVRLSAHITWRSWGEPEDHRYQRVRARNEPGFRWKSVYIVFALQALLAWIVSWSLLAAAARPQPWSWLDSLGVALIVCGGLFEAAADAQLARFKANADNAGQVMDRGLWRTTRHPNYFGECCVWWGFYLLALSASAWWAIASPVLVTVLLLKVSGVTLLEQDITERRPAYRDYVARTNAFFPWWPRA